MQSIRPALVRQSSRGSSLVLVVIVCAILLFTLAALLTFTSSSRRLESQRLENDRALYVAQGLLAQGATWLRAQSIPPDVGSQTPVITTLNTSQYTNPDPGSYNTQLKIYGQRPSDGTAFYTIVADASYQGIRNAVHPFSRRVQSTLYRENFSKYELLVEKTIQWDPNANWVAYYGLGQVFFGPMHSNSGVGMFPNLWFLSPFTTAAKGNPPVRQYNDINTYFNQILHQQSAYDYINMLSSFGSFTVPPKFYAGMAAGVPPVTMPSDKNATGMQDLYNNAKLKLPADYAGYDSSKGPNFDIQFNDPSSANGNGTITYRQYLGQNQNSPQYGPAVTAGLATIDSIAVTGNVVGLAGTIDGRVTLGAFDTATSPSHAGNGQIHITGSLEYESRKSYQSVYGTEFQYSDAPQLYTSDGQDVNLNYVETLKQQVNRINDILGLVAEQDVVVNERDLDGQRIGNGLGSPRWLYLDGIVMATGTSSGGDTGTYWPENVTGRPPGKALRFGNLASHVKQDWDYYNGNGTHTNGFVGPTLYDFRAADPTKTPPLFPTTGDYVVRENSWRESFIASFNESPTLPF